MNLLGCGFNVLLYMLDSLVLVLLLAVFVFMQVNWFVCLTVVG